MMSAEEVRERVLVARTHPCHDRSVHVREREFGSGSTGMRALVSTSDASRARPSRNAKTIGLHENSNFEGVDAVCKLARRRRAVPALPGVIHRHSQSD